MPQTRCTFVGNKFYLQPGINMITEDHPESLRYPVLRNPTASRIEGKPGGWKELNQLVDDNVEFKMQKTSLIFYLILP